MTRIAFLTCCALFTCAGQDLRSRLNEALRLQRAGLLAGADREARNALALSRGLPSAGRDHLEAIILLAGILEEEGQLEEAETHGRVAVALAEQHPEWESGVATALSNLGHTLLWRGRLAEAKVVLDRALAMASDSGQPESRAVTPLSFLALFYRLTGNPARATPLARRVLFLLQQESQPDPYIVMRARFELGENLMALRQFSSAADELARATSVMGTACVSDEHCQLIRIRLGSALVNHGRRAEGLALIEEGIHYLEPLIDSTTIRLVPPLTDLAVAYYLQRRFDEAEQVVCRALALLGRSSGISDEWQARLLRQLATIQRAQGKKKEAKAAEQQAQRMLAALKISGQDSKRWSVHRPTAKSVSLEHFSGEAEVHDVAAVGVPAFKTHSGSFMRFRRSDLPSGAGFTSIVEARKLRLRQKRGQTPKSQIRRT